MNEDPILFHYHGSNVVGFLSNQTRMIIKNSVGIVILPHRSLSKLIMNTTTDTRKVHHGRNIKRFREMFGLKQEALALELGEDWSQKKVSRLEDQEVVEDDVLKEVAKILKVPVEAIKNFDEQTALNFIGNTYTNNDYSATLNGWSVQYSPTIHPLEKLLEVIEENKKLYEQLVASEREKVQLLQRLLDERK